MRPLFIQLPCALVLAFATACGDDEENPLPPAPQPTPDAGTPDMGLPPSPGNLVEVATAAGFTALVDAAGRAGLADTLANGGPFTVFAPTDEAFAAITAPTDPQLLANVLLHHVVEGEQPSTAVLGASGFDTLAGTRIAVDSAGPTIGGAPLDSDNLDVAASNGIIHVIESVMLPPTIPEAVTASPDLSVLATAVGAASAAVRERLGSAGPITVFAPVNSAFSGIDLGMLSQAQLDAILSYHAAEGQTLESNLMDGQTLTMENGVSITVNITGTDVTLTDASGNTVNVVETDLRLLNGVVHLIDGVLMPEMDTMPTQNIVETAQVAGLTTLLDLATRSGVTSTLAEPGPFTVFAPSNAAFATAMASLPDDDNLVANVLLHHVVSGARGSASVLGVDRLDTLAGTTIAVDAGQQTVGGAELGMPLDVRATNGIVHILDGVMLPPNVPEAVAANPDLSSLGMAVGAASQAVRDALSAPGPITVFAPVNSAFTGLDLGGLTTEQIDAVLRYHLVEGQALSGALTDGQTLTTVNGQALTVTVDGSNVSLTDANGMVVRVTRPNIRLRNGVVHLIDGVLMPFAGGDIVEEAQRAGLTTLLSVATTAELDVTLQGPGPFTVFAPTNDAFTRLGADAPTDPALLANVLLNHVVPGRQWSGQVLRRTELLTVANTNLPVGATPPSVSGISIVETDVPASNGVVHVIDEVIVPPTVAAAAGALPNLSTLASAVGQADRAVASTLDGPGPITVFAPVNSAFAAIPTADLNALLGNQDRLTSILTYHVAIGQTLSTQLQDGQVITMASGEPLTVNVTPSGVTLTDGVGNTVNVIRTDIRLANGVVHLIDGVLLPGDIFELAVASSLTTLASALERVGLDRALRGTGPFTVFAPTDAAFTALGVNLPGLNDDVLANILLHHVVLDRLDSMAVLSAPSLLSLANLSLAVNAGATPPTVGGASLSSTLNVAATNGIVHVLSDVIVPPTIVDVAQATPDLSMVVTALGAASQAVQNAVRPDTLNGAAPITVFAPTNAAFATANLGTPTQAQLDRILQYHVLAGQTLSADLSAGAQSVPTALTGASLTVTRSGSTVTITDSTGGVATVSGTLRDVRTQTGVVHVIDRVLIPPAP